MKRPRLKTALFGVIVGLCALSGAISWISWSGLNKLNDAMMTIVGDSLPSVQALGTINAEYATVRLAIRDEVMATDLADMEKFEAKRKEHGENLVRAIDAYSRMVSNEAEKKLYTSMATATKDYLSKVNHVSDLAQQDHNEEARTYLKDVLLPFAVTSTDSLNQMIALNADLAKASSDAAQEKFAQSMQFLWIGIGFAVVTAISALLYVRNGISKPIAGINEAMRRLAGGDTVSDIPFAGREDEIGDMAGAVEVFRQAAIANRRLEEEAETARRTSERERIEAEQRAEEAAAERLRIATSGLAAGLRRLAAGDLSFQLSEAFAADFEALRHDFNASISQLAATMQNLTSSAFSISNSTREIASGVGDLSRRTEQQAASLEETAAALDEITVNVSNSAKKTEEARTVAAQANKSAVQSADVVSHAEEAMRRIEGSSTQISNIIGVIDEIAFQTNLLALNAGVEAARAGEAGKGFAVVAQEVRELAQRSANAAKEIKGLIQNSSSEVQVGVNLVRDAGAALKTICSYILEINSHMDSITTSAKEQATGLAEVNIAVNQMDQVTQSNAAMVEQSNAAAETLAAEAGRLRELIGQFQTGERRGSEPSPHGQPGPADLNALSAAMRQANPSFGGTASSPMKKAARAAAGQNWEDY